MSFPCSWTSSLREGVRARWDGSTFQSDTHWLADLGGSMNDLKASGELPCFACNGDHGFLSGGDGGEP